MQAKAAYKSYEKVLDKLITAAKDISDRNFIRDAGTDSTRIWKFVNSQTKPLSQSREIEKIEWEGRQITAKQEIADHLNDFYNNVGVNIVTKDGTLSRINKGFSRNDKGDT